MSTMLLCLVGIIGALFVLAAAVTFVETCGALAVENSPSVDSELPAPGKSLVNDGYGETWFFSDNIKPTVRTFDPDSLPAYNPQPGGNDSAGLLGDGLNTIFVFDFGKQLPDSERKQLAE